MKNKIKKVLLFSLIFLFLVVPISISAQGNLGDAFGDPLEQVGEESGYDTSQDSINPIISTVIQAILSLLGVIFLVLIIYGGFLWMTARGNEEQVGKAKKILSAAIIGLIIVVAAYAISWFVLSQLTERTLSPGS